MKILRNLKKPAWLIAVCTLSFSAFCTLLAYVGNFGGGFMPVIGNLIDMILFLGIIGGLLFFLITKKTELFRYFFFLYFAYWILSTIHNGLNMADFAVQGVDGIIVAYAVFEFLAALGLLAAFVLFVFIKLTKKTQLKPIILWIMLGTCAMYFLVMILYIATAAKAGWHWTSYFQAFNTFALPVGMTFAYVALQALSAPAAPEEAPAKEETAPAMEAPAEEKAAEEETVDESSAEE